MQPTVRLEKKASGIQKQRRHARDVREVFAKFFDILCRFGDMFGPVPTFPMRWNRFGCTRKHVEAFGRFSLKAACRLRVLVEVEKTLQNRPLHGGPGAPPPDCAGRPLRRIQFQNRIQTGPEVRRQSRSRLALSSAVCWMAGTVALSSAVCWIAGRIPESSLYPARRAG